MNKLTSRKGAPVLLLTVLTALLLLSAGLTAAQTAPVAQATTATPAGQATPAAATTPAAPAEPEAFYLTIRPAEDGSFTGISLILRTDGTAEFRQELNGGGTFVSETGTWEDQGDGTFTVTLTEKDGQPVATPQVMVFEREEARISLVDPDPAVWGEEGLQLNEGSAIARNLRSPMISMDLSAGFPLDPTFVSLNGGGAVDARLLGRKCNGYINSQPVMTVNWAGQADLARIFFYSDGDPSLVILTPSGELLCNDNAHGQLLDPVIEIEKPEAGMYRIWVGSVAKNQMVPGVLVLTTKLDMDLGTFDVHKLITRPSIPQKPASSRVQAAIDKVRSDFGRKMSAAPVLVPGSSVSMDTTANGDLPLFRLPEAADNGCAGLVTGLPNYTFKWDGTAEYLRVTFEGDADATLLVSAVGQDLVVCNDDAAEGTTSPAVEIPEPPAGTYVVYVGRVSPEKPVSGKLTVSSAVAQ